MSQPNFAAIAGTTKQTLFSWESGKTAPDGFLLAAFAEAGVDVLYVITGRRSLAVTEVDLLPSDERVLVDSYRRCNAEAKRNLIQTAALLSAGVPAARAPKPSSGQNAVGDNNIQIGRVGSKARIKNK
ncbi:helix-turn-helix domain-containing protein [Hydrogenophaga taeniospiralis]|uniref:helix-turn-helix domain-containing protein n=1 Tax=Hydrogenophaga taeniospiralis TaxID=65656 RepID=UPI0039B002CE